MSQSQQPWTELAFKRRLGGSAGGIRKGYSLAILIQCCCSVIKMVTKLKASASILEQFRYSEGTDFLLPVLLLVMDRTNNSINDR